MKKKARIIILVLVLLLANTINVLADTIEPRYSVITSVSCGIYPSDGEIGFDVMVNVPSSTALDSAWVDIEVRNIAGTVVGTFSGKKMTKYTSYFYYENTCDIFTSGRYFFTYEVRCYKDAVLVDNPTGTSTTVSCTA